MEPLSGTTFRTDATPVLWCAARSTDPSTVRGRMVATAIGDGTGWVRRFAAAPLLAGALNRAGYPARLAALDGTEFDGTEFVVDPAIAAQARDNPSITAVVADIGSPGDSGAVADVLRTWSGLAAERQVLLAAPRSFCAGVERAVEIVERAIVKYGSPIYVRKQIVHNIHVVRDLERRGAIFVDELDDVPADATVIFSAHGVAPAVRELALERDLRVIDATCPLVSKVHSEARRFARRGDTIVLIGHAGHEESEGTLGVAPQRTVLVEKAEDVEQLDITGPVSFLTQTTLAVDEAEHVAGALRARFPAITGPDSDDICYATTNRQLALREIAADSDLVLVIGSRNSSNSLRLVEIAQRLGVPAYLIDSVADIELDWLAGAETVGLTAGASAPPTLVDEVIETLRGLGPVTVTERRVTDESVRFSLPKTVSHVGT